MSLNTKCYFIFTTNIFNNFRQQTHVKTFTKNPKHARYKNTPHKTTRNKKITKSKTQTKNSLCCDADEFYLTYIYMFICATANKKNNTDDSDNTHHSKFLSRATTHTFSQIIIFDTPDTQKPQNKSACIHEHTIFSLYYV